MASVTGPDLDTARVAVENLMDDACIVTLDTEGTGDDVLDPDTGYLEPPAPDSTNLYNQAAVGLEGRSLADEDAMGGLCKIKPASQNEIARYNVEGGVTEAVAWYVLGLPWDAPILPMRSVALITSSRRDPALVGTLFTVRAAHNVQTMLVSRKYLVEVRTSVMNWQARVFGTQGILRATSLRATTIDNEVAALVNHWGALLNTRIKAKASGRPGPNAPTGDYRRSWTHEFHSQGSEAISINGTNAPQGRRLEFGFVGTDSLGRNYNQPPFPHVGPAKDEIEPEYVNAVRQLVRTI